MTRQLFIFTLLSGILLWGIGCSRPFGKTADRSFHINGDHLQPFSIAISGRSMELPLMIEAPTGRTGAIYYKTRESTILLSDRPQRIIDNGHNVMARWCIGDQDIVLTIIQDGADFILRLNSENGPKILGWGIYLSATADEYFTGLFERVIDGNQKKSWEEGITEAMNLRGQNVDMIVKPTLSLYSPFYLSSRNYGLFISGTWPGNFDFCKENPNHVRVEFEGPSLELKIYTAEHPAEIVKAHSLRVGPPLVPPKWAFTHWRWRNEHLHLNTYYDGTKVDVPYNSQVVEDILMMEALDIPCGVYWIDRPWAKGYAGYDDFDWDPNRFPNIERMIQWLDSKDINMLVWIAPWLNGEIAKEAVEKGYKLDGQKGFERNPRVVLMDFTNPEARRWWQQRGPGSLLKIGVKGFKLDRAEEAVPESYDHFAYDGRTTRENRNDYVVQYVRATYEICREMLGDDFVLMPRAGYTGSSRYAVFWGGDTASFHEGLRSAIIALQRCAIIGYPYWGSDTGGFGGRGHIFRQLHGRWVQFSCFCPIMEVGPSKERGYWATDPDPNKDSYDEILLAIWRTYAKIHTDLTDYTYQCAQKAHETGMPIVRPLFLEFPVQPSAWQHWQSYMYGPDILVSPVWEKNKKSQDVFLPAGVKWRDAWDKETIYEGGQMVTVDTPIYKIPIFVRADSKTDLGDLNALYQKSLEIAKNRPNLAELQKTVQ